LMRPSLTHKILLPGQVQERGVISVLLAGLFSTPN
jgi:hypothetical protein